MYGYTGQVVQGVFRAKVTAGYTRLSQLMVWITLPEVATLQAG